MIKFNVNKYYMHLFFPTICSYPLSTCLFFLIHWAVFFILERLALCIWVVSCHVVCTGPSISYFKAFITNSCFCVYTYSNYRYLVMSFSSTYFEGKICFYIRPKRDVYGYMMVQFCVYFLHAECSSATVVVVSLNNYKPLL